MRAAAVGFDAIFGDAPVQVNHQFGFARFDGETEYARFARSGMAEKLKTRSLQRCRDRRQSVPSARCSGTRLPRRESGTALPMLREASAVVRGRESPTELVHRESSRKICSPPAPIGVAALHDDDTAARASSLRKIEIIRRDFDAVRSGAAGLHGLRRARARKQRSCKQQCAFSRVIDCVGCGRHVPCLRTVANPLT